MPTQLITLLRKSIIEQPQIIEGYYKFTVTLTAITVVESILLRDDRTFTQAARNLENLLAAHRVYENSLELLDYTLLHDEQP